MHFIRTGLGLASLSLSLSLCGLHAADDAAAAKAKKSGEQERHLVAKDVFDYGKAVLFQDDFQSGQFEKWTFSEDDRYRLVKEDPARIQIMDAPQLSGGRKATRFVVPRAPNSFRAEVSLPSEKGFNERWYSERMLVPGDWVFDPGKGNDIVMQWHAIPGNSKPTYPNLEISIGNANWFIRQSYGSAQTNPTRTNEKLAAPVQKGVWVAWVIHAKWAPGADGLLQIWKDGELVLERHGPNVYSTLGAEYTPYMKTGIYHPEWHLDKDRKREAFEKETPVATSKTIYVTDVKVGGEKATFEEMSPKP